MGKKISAKAALKHNLISEMAELTRKVKIDLVNISNYEKEVIEEAKKQL